MRFALVAITAFAGLVSAQLGAVTGGQIPSACFNDCNKLQEALAPACGTLLNSTDPLSAFPKSGKRQAASTYTQCASALCNPTNFGSFTSCVNCLVANGQPGLTASSAGNTVTQISSLCGVIGSSVSGTVTATGATTTGPFTSFALTAASAASNSTSNGASSTSASASRTSAPSTSSTSKAAGFERMEFSMAGLGVGAVAAVGAIMGAILI